MPKVRVELGEDERQAVLLALGELGCRRPGWVDFLREIAGKLDGLELFEEFKRHANPEAPRSLFPASESPLPLSPK